MLLNVHILCSLSTTIVLIAAACKWARIHSSIKLLTNQTETKGAVKDSVPFMFPIEDDINKE